MDDSAPDRSICYSPYFPEPKVMCPPPVSGFSQSHITSTIPIQLASTLPSCPPAAHGQPTMPISGFTLDVETTGIPCLSDAKLPVQSTVASPSTLADSLNRLVGISEQLLSTLQSSNIVEKRAGDDRSRFWTVYKKAADEHDNEFFERHDSDMDIVLIFSGLFSAVNTTFIVSMGPSNSTATNILLAQIVTLMVMENNGTSIGDISPVPAPPAYSNGQVWFQALAYASLSFSLLAAFGAVLGKQWLRVYKLERSGHGSLEERGKNRQMKLEGLEAWHFDAVLQTFPILLQFSLLLFGISLSSYIWTQQRTITAIVIAATVLGCMFYAFTLFASLLSPICPFQTTASFILRMTGAFVWAGNMIGTKEPGSNTFRKRFRSFIYSIRTHVIGFVRQLLNPQAELPGDRETGSAIRWLLTTSTDPENIAAAAALIPTTTLLPHSDIALYYPRLRDTFVGCFEIDGRPRPSAEERAVHCGRALNHLCLGGTSIDIASQPPRMWRTWRSIILPRAFDGCKTLAVQLQVPSGKDKQISGKDREKCQAGMRTELRMMIAASGDGFIHPNEEKIIWRGRFTWDGDCRTAADFNWLVDYLRVVSCSKDDEAMGDAILALSAVKDFDNWDRISIYLEVLISALTSDHPHRVRYAVLRALSDSKMSLVDISAKDERVRSLLLMKLSPALLEAIPMGSYPHVTNYFRDDAYLGLIVTLASNEEWCKHLVGDHHMGRCIFILNHLDEGSRAPFHLAAIFGRVYAMCPDTRALEAVPVAQFSSLAKLAWKSVLDLKLYDEDECTSVLPAVINFTAKQEAIQTADLNDIRRNVRAITDKLKRRNTGKHTTIICEMESYYTQLTRLYES